MRPIDRTFIMFTILALAAPLHVPAMESAEGSKGTFLIAGSVGLPGVVMNGLPGQVVTDERGRYRAWVGRDWQGVVRPEREGFRFTPPSRQYDRVQGDLQNENYVAQVLAYEISGTTGVPGVCLKGLPGDPITDGNGNYSVTVDYGWAGVVTPEKEGYVFTPTSRNYAAAKRGFENQDYAAATITLTISGNVGLSDVLMQGLPGRVVTDANGRYAVKVPYGWMGFVVPQKEGHEFDPPEQMYGAVVEDRTDQDFVGRVQMLTISDRVVFGDEPIPGVTVTASPGGYSAVTDSDGRYRIQVPYGWSGDLTIAREGFAFAPSSIPYTNVISHIVDGKSVPVRSGTAPAIPWPRPPSAYRQTGIPDAVSDVLIVPTTRVMPEQFAEIAEDMRVMLHILREKLSASAPRMILGTLPDYGDFFGGERGREAFYVQGYGAMFVMEVDFAFSAPSEQGPDTEVGLEPVDPVWQRAREYLWSPQYPTRYRPPRLPAEPQQMDFDFDRFKEDLLDTLKHAANIRNIEPNELVILTVVGQGERTAAAGPSGAGGSYSTGGWGGFGGGGGSLGAGGGSFGGGSFGGGSFYMDSRSRSRVRRDTRSGRSVTTAPMPTTTVLTMQAKKADIDAFAHGDIDLMQFQQKVKVFTY